MIDKLTSMLCRLFFAISLILLVLAIWDRVLRFFGWSISVVPYDPGRMLEISAILMVFVIAMLLRQIRENLRSRS